MGKFANMCGKLEFKIKDEEISLTPKVGDNRRLLKIMNGGLNETEKMDKVFEFITDLLIHNYPEESQDDLKLALEFNLNDFMKEVLIGFGWTTREKWNSLENDAEKKLMSGN